MNKIATTITLFSLLLVTARCSTQKGTTATPVQTDEMKLAEIKSKYTEAEIEQGRITWQGSCGRCHKLYEPADFRISKWERVLPSMINRAALSDEEGGRVRAYILTHTKVN